MALTFDHASVDGVISAAGTHHLVSQITAANYQSPIRSRPSSTTA